MSTLRYGNVVNPIQRGWASSIHFSSRSPIDMDNVHNSVCSPTRRWMNQYVNFQKTVTIVIQLFIH